MSHVLSKDHFAKVIRLDMKIFCFCKFCDAHIKKENKTHESTRNQYENSKIPLGHCKAPSNIFCFVCDFLIPERRSDRHFLLTKKQ